MGKSRIDRKRYRDKDIIDREIDRQIDVDLDEGRRDTRDTRDTRDRDIDGEIEIFREGDRRIIAAIRTCTSTMEVPLYLYGDRLIDRDRYLFIIYFIYYLIYLVYLPYSFYLFHSFSLFYSYYSFSLSSLFYSFYPFYPFYLFYLLLEE